MSDIRFRLAIIFLLSFLSFISFFGAVAALIWWAIFGAKKTLTNVSWRILLFSIIFVVVFPSIVLQFTGGVSPVSYGVRMMVILLLAFWFGSERSSGEFFDLFVWSLGKKIGFELGMTAELSMQALSGIADDYSHMKTALKMKGEKRIIRTVSSLSSGLLMLSLARAENISIMLARRGYTFGGTYVPNFSPKRIDYLGFFSAAAILVPVLIFFLQGYTLIL